MFSDYFLPATLAIIMFGLGLTLTVKDFKRLLHYPKALFVGLICQMVLFPLLAFTMAWGIGELFGLAATVQVGLVLVTICPGGSTSNLVDYLLRANVALGVSLTSVNSFLTLFTIPFFLNLAFNLFMGETQYIDLPFWDTVRRILLLVILPTAVGMVLRAKWPAFALKAERPFSWGGTGLLALAFLGVLFLDEGGQQEMGTPSLTFMTVLPLVLMGLILNSGGMSLGYFTGQATGLGPRNRLTIAVEVGLQNISLALVIAAEQLNEPKMAEVAVIYGSFTFITTLLFGYFLNLVFGDGKAYFSLKRKRRKQALDAERKRQHADRHRSTAARRSVSPEGGQ
jgi:BASS family bile acid:Na+ symporter